MDELFGGSLVIQDAFTSAFSSFKSSISKAKWFQHVHSEDIESERANRRRWTT